MFNSVQSHAISHILGRGSSQTSSVPAQQNTDLKIGEAFHKFTKSSYTSEGELIKKDFEVLGDDWRKLAGKQGKTDAELQKLDTEYKNAFTKLGKSYIEYIDKSFGNGDGVLTQAEYEAFENETIPEEFKNDAAVMAEVKQMQQNAFNHLNLNKDDKIDAEEMASYLYVLDYATEEGKPKGLNGKISSYDADTNSKQLGRKGKIFLDTQLAYAYNALFGKKAAE